MFLIILMFVRIINLEIDVLIIVVVMFFFGMESFDDKVEFFILLDILKVLREKRRVWFYSYIKNMLVIFVMFDEYEIIREIVVEVNRLKVFVVRICRVCGKTYKYVKVKENYERR